MSTSALQVVPPTNPSSHSETYALVVHVFAFINHQYSLSRIVTCVFFSNFFPTASASVYVSVLFQFLVFFFSTISLLSFFPTYFFHSVAVSSIFFQSFFSPTFSVLIFGPVYTTPSFVVSSSLLLWPFLCIFVSLKKFDLNNIRFLSM